MARRDKRKKTLRKNTRRNSRRISRKNTLKNTKRNSKRKNTRRNSLRKNTLRKNLKKQRIQKKHKGGSGLSSAQQNKFWSTRKLKQGPDPNDPRNPTHGIYGSLLPKISTNQSMGPQPPPGQPTSASPSARRRRTTTQGQKKEQEAVHKFTQDQMAELRRNTAKTMSEAWMTSGPYTDYMDEVTADHKNIQKFQRGVRTKGQAILEATDAGAAAAKVAALPATAATKEIQVRRLEKAQLRKITDVEAVLPDDWKIVPNIEGGIGGFYHVIFKELSQLQANDGDISRDDVGLKFNVDGQEYPVVIDYDDSKSPKETRSTLQTIEIAKLVEDATEAVDAKYDEDDDDDDAPGANIPNFNKEMKAFKKEIKGLVEIVQEAHKQTVEKVDIEGYDNAHGPGKMQQRAHRLASTYDEVKDSLETLRKGRADDKRNNIGKNQRTLRIKEAYKLLLKLDKRWEDAALYARQEISDLNPGATNASRLVYAAIEEVIAAAHTHPDGQSEIAIADGVFQILSVNHLFATVNEYDGVLSESWARRHIVEKNDDYPGLDKWITGAGQNAKEEYMHGVIFKICKKVNESRGVKKMRSKVLNLINKIKKYIKKIIKDINELIQAESASERIRGVAEKVALEANVLGALQGPNP